MDQSWTPGTTGRERGRLRRSFMEHQLLNVVAVEVSAPLIALVLGTGLFIVTEGTFLCIKAHHSMNTPILLGIAMEMSFIVIVFKVVLFITVDLRDASMAYPKSFHKNVIPLPKLDQAFFRACRPIQIWFADLFPFETRTFFLSAMSGIVLANVVNLIVTF